MKTKTKLLLVIALGALISVAAGFAVNLNGSIIDASTGFQYNAAAPLNHFLCGNGSEYVDCPATTAAAGVFNDYSGTNLCGTVYQNTTGQAETVNITHEVSGSSGATMTGFIGPTSTPGDTVGVWSAVAAFSGSASIMGSFRVPNNWYYEVTRDNTASNCGITNWTIVTP